jgi:hypothetical protein
MEERSDGVGGVRAEEVEDGVDSLEEWEEEWEVEEALASEWEP